MNDSRRGHAQVEPVHRNEMETELEVIDVRTDVLDGERMINDSAKTRPEGR
jgi:hypothetical protein